MRKRIENGALLGIIKRSRPQKSEPDLYIFGVPGYFEGYYKGYSDVVRAPRWFWQLGVGTFDVQPGRSTQGISGGVGWQKPIGCNLEFEAAGLLFHLFSSAGQADIDFAVAQVGLKLAY